ncbi:uncharacterized protein LOC143561454 [Bidens hawaiensis]|uniref:uncharacterized protein LOC143561454 n=1 Tax=Bidens hawaiensis TaxID=980011 RepID=UPI00404982F0
MSSTTIDNTYNNDSLNLNGDDEKSNDPIDDDNHSNDPNENVNEMLHDMETDMGDAEIENLQHLFEDAEKPLYPGSNFKKLDTMLNLLNLKLKNGWSDKSFTELLVFWHDRLPRDNELPISTYQAKKLMCPMGLEVEKFMHAQITINDFGDVDDEMTKKRPPAKVLWYLPIIPRLKRLFSNEKEAKLLRWHSEERVIDGKLRHVADSPQWKTIDNKYREFGKEARNIWFGLSSDGISPFGTIVVAIVRGRFFYGSTIFHNGSETAWYVYLSPLIDDLKTLWDSGVKGKTKDGEKVRKDMVLLYKRTNLAPQQIGDRVLLPLACYITTLEERRQFCQCLHDIKVPSTYSSNIKRLVSLKDRKLLGMKSHDCHVLMTHMIPIAIRGLLPDDVRNTITKLCLFFNNIHSKVIDVEQLDKWEKDIYVTLCELEMYFPPSFFDIMVHLIAHIVQEIKACGPVYLRYMYPFERYMGVLKGHVRNRNRPEGSIIEGYTSEEVIEFCKGYMEGVDSVGVPKTRHSGRLEGHAVVGLKAIIPNREDVQTTHLVVLKHMACLAPYVNEHMEMLRSTNPNKDDIWYIKTQNKELSRWMRNKVKEIDVDETVKRLGDGPDCRVKSYQGYDINGCYSYTFYTSDRDKKSAVQNSGVTLIASTTELYGQRRETMIKIAKDSYYGVIQEIWELDYHDFKIPLFRCKWVNNRTGVQVDKYGFTLVDLATDGYRSEPFVMAKHVTQVFFVKDPSKPRYHIVLQGKRHILGVDNVVNEEEDDHFDDLPPFSVDIEPSDYENMRHTTYLRDDIDEIYVD